MKVYFNNSCKICKTEIDLYKKEEIKEIDWIDITNNDIAEKETSKSSKELLRRLHVKEGDKFLYKFLKTPIIFNLFSFGYEIVAYLLYLKNKKQLKLTKEK